MSNVVKLIWSDIEILVEKLASDIQQQEKKYQYIMGLPRGGLIPAVMLSHILDIKLVDDQYINFCSFDKPVLIVDDIMDSGKTLNKIPNSFDKAVLFCKMKIEENNRPTYYGSQISDNIWLMFPWEKDINDSVSKANYQDYHKEKI
jgi:hypoxanthine phosphoribosyltransferase